MKDDINHYPLQKLTINFIARFEDHLELNYWPLWLKNHPAVIIIHSRFQFKD